MPDQQPTTHKFICPCCEWSMVMARIADPWDAGRIYECGTCHVEMVPVEWHRPTQARATTPPPPHADTDPQ